MAKAPFLYMWAVSIRWSESGLTEFKGEVWAPSEVSACNKVRARVWGREVPYDHIGGAIFAERVEGSPPIPNQPRPHQQRFC